MDFFKILNGGVGLGMSNFDRLFAEKHGGEDWQLTTLTGALPLSFKSKGTPLTDYKLYGTAEGAGVETESGEPSGYKLPMTVESGEESTTTPIYIGDSKLMAEEYVDYGEQKMYKYAEPLKIYGWHVDPSISDPANAITYLGDAVGKTPAAMGTETFSYGDWENAFFMPKPCMVKYNGTVDYYLNPNDYSKKIDGTDSDIANSEYEGNAMVEWPLIFYKFEAGTTDGEGYFYCSNIKVDDSYSCWCNYDANGNIIEHFYTSIYNGTGTTNMRSLSGIQLTSANGNGRTSGSTEVTRATANNTTSTVEWYTSVFSDRILINALHILISKTLNCEAAFGHGITSGSQSDKEAYVTGSLDNKGMFYGDISGTTTAVKTFGMENWWGLVWDRTAGCVGLTNGTTSIKLTYSTVDGTTTTGYNSSGEGYINLNWTRPFSGYVKSCRYNQYVYFPINTSGASATTYYCDYWYTDNSALTYLLVGGSSAYGTQAGFSYFSLHGVFSDAYWAFAARLSLKPLAKTTPEPELIPTDPPVALPELSTYQGENTLSCSEGLGEISITGYIKGE